VAGGGLDGLEVEVRDRPHPDQRFDFRADLPLAVRGKRRFFFLRIRRRDRARVANLLVDADHARKKKREVFALAATLVSCVRVGHAY
jgi:hypothetical protein